MASDYTALRRALPEVLRAWQQGAFSIDAWDSSVYLAEHFHSHPGLASGNVELRRSHIQDTIRAALQELARQAPDAAQLLRARYFARLQRGEIAAAQWNRQHRSATDSVNRIKHNQRRALDALTRVLVQLEETARELRAARINARLDLEPPPELIGHAAERAQALEALLHPQGPWILSLDGLGGIGKTTLANVLVRMLAPQPAFADVVWISARQTYFSFSEGPCPDLRRQAALTYPQLLLELAAELGVQDAPTPQQAGARLRDTLKAAPYLVVIDNLETVQDYQELLPELLRLTGPSKFLLTSRESLQHVPEVLSIHVLELAAEEFYRLIRYTAHAQSIPELADAPESILHRIYEVTGGNPLAAILIVGQAHAAELESLINELREARTQSADELFRFIYWRSWHALSPVSRAVLFAMPAFADSGARLDMLASATQLDQYALRAALNELQRYALLVASGSTQALHYHIHRLTEVFLLHEVLKWMEDPSA